MTRYLLLLFIICLSAPILTIAISPEDLEVTQPENRAFRGTNNNMAAQAEVEVEPRVLIGDTSLPTPIILTAETAMIGGGGGNDYRDQAITDPSVKASGFRFKSGALIDGLNVMLSNGAQAEYHGGSGGSDYQTLQFPNDTRVSNVRVWVANNFIYGLMMIYENGAMSNVIGNKADDAYDVPIYGNLVGIKGRSGAYLDSISFISNVMSLDPNHPQTVPIYSDFRGGNGGARFDTVTSSGLPSNPSAKVKTITVRSGAAIDAISISSTSFGYSSPRFGGDGGNENTINVEDLSYIEVWSKDMIVGLNFVKSSGSNFVGSRDGVYYKVNVPSGARLVGIYGRSGSRVDRLGFIFARTA